MSKKKRSLFQLIFLISAVSNPWLIASVVMSVVSAGMAVMQGYQQQRIANQNAKMQMAQAERERQAAKRNAQSAAQRRKRERAQATVAYAASGVLVDEGSPLIVEAEDDYRSEVNEATIIAQGEDTAWRSRSAAAIESAKGRAAGGQGYGRAAGAIASGACLLA